jgi:hypothetical protein
MPHSSWTGRPGWGGGSIEPADFPFIVSPHTDEQVMFQSCRYTTAQNRVIADEIEVSRPAKRESVMTVLS